MARHISLNTTEINLIVDALQFRARHLQMLASSNGDMAHQMARAYWELAALIKRTPDDLATSRNRECNKASVVEISK